MALSQRVRRPLVTTLAGTLAIAGLAGCGGHKKPAALPPATTIPPTTTTTLPPPRSPVDPLDGYAVTHHTARNVAVVVKIDNLQEALPQTGLDSADVVYEELVEGGLTRLAAVFQSSYPSVVGPVRSGRLTDEGIADDLGHPVLAFAGANGLFLPVLSAQPVHVVDDDNYPDLYYRNNAQEAPHNLYADVASLAATEGRTGPPPALWRFRPVGAPFRGKGAVRVSQAVIPFPAAMVQWNWDRASHHWLRTQNGAADVDSAGQRLSANNVIIEFIPYTISAYVSGEGPAAQGDPIPDGQQVGHGTAWYLSGGKLVRGSWSRTSLTTPAVYRDGAGHEIRLAPGRTWVELVPAGTPVSVTQ